MQKKKLAISLLSVSIIALSCVAITTLGNNKKPEEVDPYIISEVDTVKKDKDGKFIYESLDGRSIAEFYKMIPPDYIDKQNNKCVKQLLGNIDKKNHFSCFEDGYTYALISYGKSKDSITFQLDPLVETEEGELRFGYRYEIDPKNQLSEEKHNFMLFKIPTDKKIKFSPLMSVEDSIAFYEEKFEYFTKEMDGLPLFERTQESEETLNKLKANPYEHIVGEPEFEDDSRQYLEEFIKDKDFAVVNENTVTQRDIEEYQAKVDKWFEDQLKEYEEQYGPIEHETEPEEVIE